MGRFKRSFLGYRRDQVEAAMSAAEGRALEADRELLILSEMLVSREREIELLSGQLADAHARHDRSLTSLETLARHIDDLHAQARGQATRIRMKALNEAVRVTERAGSAMGAIREIEDAAESIGAARSDLAESRRASIESDGAHTGARRPADEPRRSPGEPPRAADEPRADGNGSGNRNGNGNGSSYSGAGADGSADLGFYQGDVEVEIGPLGDFSQLLGFESAAGRIEGASEISVRRFASGRVTLGMRLDEPIELLRELEERSPFEFKVRQTGGRRLVLDIDEDSATGEAA